MESIPQRAEAARYWSGKSEPRSESGYWNTYLGPGKIAPIRYPFPRNLTETHDYSGIPALRKAETSRSKYSLLAKGTWAL